MLRENSGTAVTKALYTCDAFPLSVVSNYQKRKLKKY